MEIKNLRTERVIVPKVTVSTSSTKTENGMQKRNLWKEGVPGWVYPATITIYALTERVLAGLKVGSFLDLANSANNWLPELLLVSLSGTLGWRTVKLVNQRLESKSEKQATTVSEGS